MERIIFSLLIFFLPSQLAYHFWPEWAHIFGIRVDYLAPTIYLSDIFVFLLLTLQIQKLKIKDQKYKLKRKYIVITALLIGFIAINILFAKSMYPAIYKWGKIIEYGLLGLYVAKSKNLEIQSWLIKPLALSVILFSLIGIAQFVKGGTIGGPLYYLGERNFNTSTPGIALVTLWGREFLRAYSTFPHPNSMAGYLIVATVLFATFLKAKKDLLIKRLAIFLGMIAIFLSFSFGGYIAILTALIFSLIKTKSIKWILVVFIFTSLVFPLYSNKLLTISDFPETVRERIFLANKSWKVFTESPLAGIGLNNFFTSTNSLQPVHNLSLLILSETGAVGLLLILYFLIRMIGVNNPLRGGSRKFEVLILIILVTGLVDHYWLTLQQNQLLLSIIFGLSLRVRSENLL